MARRPMGMDLAWGTQSGLSAGMRSRVRRVLVISGSGARRGVSATVMAVAPVERTDGEAKRLVAEGWRFVGGGAVDGWNGEVVGAEIGAELGAMVGEVAEAHVENGD